jgi:hypothetical protein
MRGKGYEARMEGLFPLSRMAAGGGLRRRGKGAPINFLDDHGNINASSICEENGKSEMPPDSAFRMKELPL